MTSLQLKNNLNGNKFLLISLISVGIVLLIANILTEEKRTVLANLMYVPIPGALVIVSIVLTIRFRLSGMHGKSWLLFSCFSIVWFTAEQIWLIYELVLNIDPWPSLADFFYLLGYPILFSFMVIYLHPFKKAISKKAVISASLVSLTMLIPSLIISYQPDSYENSFEIGLALLYPIMDSIILVPSIIGVWLFFKGEVSFLWSLLVIAVVLNVIGDTGFLLFTMDDTYYTGHPVDLCYLWAYVFFTFGVYSHIKLFNNRIDERYENIDELR